MTDNSVEFVSIMDDIMREAVLYYHAGSYDVITPGTYVVCAVSGLRIYLQGLKYWNAERQEPYANARFMLQRHQEFQ